jgi:hypothetical protein
MDDLWKLIADQLSERVDGPMKFRVFLQPTMAVLLAIKSGLNDAKTGARPYFWSLLTTSGHRAEMLKDGWKSVGRLFLLAVVLDLVFQIIVEPSIHLRAAIFVAIILAIIPYVLLRGIVTRIASRLITRPTTRASADTTSSSRDADGRRP